MFGFFQGSVINHESFYGGQYFSERLIAAEFQHEESTYICNSTPVVSIEQLDGNVNLI
jgi:hypothetical protein